MTDIKKLIAERLARFQNPRGALFQIKEEVEEELIPVIVEIAQDAVGRVMNEANDAEGPFVEAAAIRAGFFWKCRANRTGTVGAICNYVNPHTANQCESCGFMPLRE